MQALITAARDAGHWKLLSRVFPENAASRALLASLGFREVGTYERHARRGDQCGHAGSCPVRVAGPVRHLRRRVTFSLQQLSEGYSPRLRRRHVSPHLGVLAVLIAVAGGMVAVKNASGATPVALGLLFASVGYALWLLPQRLGLVSLDLHTGDCDWMTGCRTSCRTCSADGTCGVTLITVLSSARDRDDLEVTLNQGFEDRPELLADGWCSTVLVQAWKEELAEHNAGRRSGVLIAIVRRRLQVPGAPGVRELIVRTMTSVQDSASWRVDLRELVVDVGLMLTYSPSGPGREVLRIETEEVQDAQDIYEVKVGHLRRAAFAKREELISEWTKSMGRDLLNGLDWAHRMSRRYPDRYPTSGLLDDEPLCPSRPGEFWRGCGVCRGQTTTAGSSRRRFSWDWNFSGGGRRRSGGRQQFRMNSGKNSFRNPPQPEAGTGSGSRCTALKRRGNEGSEPGAGKVRAGQTQKCLPRRRARKGPPSDAEGCSRG